MGRGRDPGTLAQELLRMAGLDAIHQARSRAESCRREGDRLGARYWASVAHEITRLAVTERATRATDRPAGARPASERIATYHQRAIEAERRAMLAPSEAVREELIAVAGQWQDLAASAEALAREAGERRRT